MPLSDSGSALFADSADEFVRMLSERSLTTFVTAHYTRLYSRPAESQVRAWRAGWIASKDASFDPAIVRRKHDPQDLRALVQHTYRVLMTRGMLGNFVYSSGHETRRHLRALARGRSMEAPTCRP